MGWLQMAYTVRFNHRHRRSGHLFQGRYKAQLVEADAYAQGLVLYVHLNPVRPRRKQAALPAERAGEIESLSLEQPPRLRRVGPPTVMAQWATAGLLGARPGRARRVPPPDRASVRKACG